MYLLERYQPIYKDDNDNYYLIDAMDINLAQNVVVLGITTISGSKYTMVTYFKNNPNSNSDSTRRAFSQDIEIPNEILSILEK